MSRKVAFFLFACLFFTCLLLGPLSHDLPAQAQTAASSFHSHLDENSRKLHSVTAVTSQTLRGVTVRVSNVRWSPIDPEAHQFAYHKVFMLDYDVHAQPPLVLPPGKSLLDFVTSVTAISPNGDALDAPGSGRYLDKTGATTKASCNWKYIDPNWPLVALDIDFLDPAAPARATGHSDAPIIIENIPVPLPAQVGQVVPIHVETLTPLGTHVIAEKIKVDAEAGGHTTIVFHVVPDPAAPDLQFNCSTGNRAVDDTGHFLGNGGSIGNSDRLATEPAPILPGYWTTVLFGMPVAGAKTLRLTLGSRESSAMLTDDTWYRHFHLLLPVSSMDRGALRSVAPLATVTGVSVVGVLDSIGWQWDRLRTRLVLRDKSDPAVSWRLKSISGQDDAGRTLVGYSGADYFFWKCDGLPVAEDESATERMLGLPGTRSGPYGVLDAPADAKSLALTVTAEAVQEREHLLDFPNIPIPEPGHVQTLNRQARDAFGDYLLLSKVYAYSPAHPLPFEIPNLYHLFTAPSGIAVVLVEHAATPGSNKSAAPRGSDKSQVFDYHLIAANDATRRRLRQVSSRGRIDGDVLVKTVAMASSPGAPATDKSLRVVTLLLREASPGMHTFNLRMGRDEERFLGKQETLTFPRVSLPAK